MKVYSSPDTYTGNNTVVTIGMFDGVHIGHQKLIDHVIEKAHELKGQSAILTFWPHPRLVLDKGGDDLQFITTLDEKTKIISQKGIEHLLLLPFSKELANMTAEEFIKEVLINKIGMTHLVVGYNHRFGKDRIHDFESYLTLSQKLGFSISKVEAVAVQDEVISSTAIRQSLNRGLIEKANRMLGYSFSIFGTVKGGQKLGRTLGYPTANITPNEHYKLIPSTGVYACWVDVMGRRYGGMMNLGIRPTVNKDKSATTIEVHILDFNQDIYSEEIEIIFVKKIRDEQKFKGLDALKEQLKKDEGIIRSVLSELTE
ncbi:bifunctional riboflavin kinase/FAD synthetase [Labilibacter sediminis]|nr:bifunctional riboflavin kinase/FAD synthetase [Labilibacter sediminis]